MKSPREQTHFQKQGIGEESTHTNVESSSPKNPERLIRGWRLWLPLLCQITLILSVPAQAVYTHITGRTVILQTAPVDPYDFLRGYYQTLSYDISSLETLRRLPGGKDLQNLQVGNSFYVILQAPQAVKNAGRPPAWKPVQVSLEQPKNLPGNQIAIKGKYDNWRVQYGLETYYMPEDRRESVNDDITATQRRQQQAFVVEVKVGSSGHAVPVSLWVGERNYRF